jgi:hypothetical protein
MRKEKKIKIKFELNISKETKHAKKQGIKKKKTKIVQECERECRKYMS